MPPKGFLMKELFFLSLIVVACVFGYKGATESLADRGIIDRSWHDAPESHVQSPIKVGDVSYVSPIVVTPERKSLFGK
jgi:hypothetical protein